MHRTGRPFVALLLAGISSLVLLSRFVPRASSAEGYRSYPLSDSSFVFTRSLNAPEFGRAKDIEDNFSLAVLNDQIDAFQVSLPPLLPHFKNPCWLETLPDDPYRNNYFKRCHLRGSSAKKNKQTMFHFEFMSKIVQARKRNDQHWRIRCFPSFFLLGFTKCGTTEIFHTLTKYAKDFAPPALKEPHYWDRRRSYPAESACDADTERMMRFASYLDAFDKAAEGIRTHPIVGDDGLLYHTHITGDFSPSTISLDLGWHRRQVNRGQREPVYTTADYLHGIYPRAKFVVIMRDPVERFYSNYRMHIRSSQLYKRNNYEATVLSAAVRSIGQMADCERNSTTRACVYNKLSGRSVVHLTRGLYHVYIRDWLKVFPRDQFLFINSEDYKLNRVKCVSQLINFLGLEPLSHVQLVNLRQEEAVLRQAHSQPSSTPPLDKRAEQLLRDFYRPHNAQLMEILQDEAFDWNSRWN